MHYSIVTVSFNSEKTIERTIISLLSQTIQKFEYIIIDGGSTDNTLKIINNYVNQFSGRLRYISEPDTGIYNAMNKGIQMAKGNVIGIVNSDDWLESNTLEILSSYIEKQEININSKFILTGWMTFHYKSNHTQIIKISQDYFYHYTKKYRMGLNHPATFVSKKTYEEIGIFDENLKLYADADFIIRCHNAGVMINFINATLSNMSDEGASNKTSVQCLKDRKYLLLKHSKNKQEYIMLYASSICRHYIKALLPTSLLKLVRSYTFK